VTSADPLPFRFPFNLSVGLGVAAKFTGIVQGMKNSANPLVSVETGRVVEYPVNVWRHGEVSADTASPVCQSQPPPPSPATVVAGGEEGEGEGEGEGGSAAAADRSKPDVCLTEAFDLGHRHFSSMHWVYPGLFLPSDRSTASSSSSVQTLDRQLLRAARKTLADKALHLSGHTG
jgi:hypothetical protein